MKLQRLSTSISLVIGTVLAISNSAQAANFTTNVEQKNGVEGDTILKSVTQKNANGSQTNINRFSLVQRAIIQSNTPITDYKAGDTSNPEASGRNNNTGAASTDKGDKATAPMSVSGMKDPTGKEIAAFLGNQNLSNIIDTEDAGSFVMDLFFDQSIRSDNTGLDNLFFWERGMNSNMTIYGLDDQGKQVGNAVRLFANAPKELTDTLNTLKSQENTLKNAVNSVQSSVNSLKNSVNSLKNSISTLQSSINTLQTQINTLLNKTTLTSSQKNDLANKQTQLGLKQADMTSKNSQLDQKQTELTNKQTELTNKQTELTNKQAQVAKAQQNINNVTQASAGYSIDTMEIGAAQTVGSWGVSLSQFGANISSLGGIRIQVNGAIDNGPDFKVMARAVPEPGTVAALGLFAAGAVGSLRRRRINQA